MVEYTLQQNTVPFINAAVCKTYNVQLNNVVVVRLCFLFLLCYDVFYSQPSLSWIKKKCNKENWILNVATEWMDQVFYWSLMLTPFSQQSLPLKYFYANAASPALAQNNTVKIMGLEFSCVRISYKTRESHRLYRRHRVYMSFSMSW